MTVKHDDTVVIPPRKLTMQERAWLYRVYGEEQARQIKALPLPMVWDLYLDVLTMGPKGDRLAELTRQLSDVFDRSEDGSNGRILTLLASHDPDWWQYLFQDKECRARATQLASTLPNCDKSHAVTSIAPLLCMIAAHDVERHRSDFVRYCQPYLKIQGQMFHDLGIDTPALFPELDWS